MNELNIASILIGAAAFALLWSIEPLIPAFKPDSERRLGRRIRNIVLGLINAAVAGLGFGLLTATVLEATRAYDLGVLNLLRPDAAFEDAPWLHAAVFVAAFCCLDLWHYTLHVLCHKVPVLWRMHAVHHHDPDMDVTTAVRFHFGEIAVQCTLSLAVYPMLGVTLAEVILYQAVLLPVAMFHHANVRVPRWLDRPLSWLIVTPNIHYVHHSPWVTETDSNFASVLSVWDRLFGTMRLVPDAHRIRFGLDGFERTDHATLRGMLTTPLLPRRATLGDEASSRKGGKNPACDAERRPAAESTQESRDRADRRGLRGVTD